MKLKRFTIFTIIVVALLLVVDFTMWYTLSLVHNQDNASYSPYQTFQNIHLLHKVIFKSDSSSVVDFFDNNEADGETNTTAHQHEHSRKEVDSLGNAYHEDEPQVLDNDPSNDQSPSNTDHTSDQKNIEPYTPRSLTNSQFNIHNIASTRGKLDAFIKVFNDGDYIVGSELADLYLDNTHLSKLLKNTVVSYIKKHIEKIEREGNALVIYTNELEGIHSHIKIPLVEDIQIDIENGSRIEFGNTFVSKHDNFQNVYLLPINFKKISFVENDKPFPSKGFISGDLFYINYPNTLQCYRLKK
jgi:hypothetical protein